MQRYPHSEKSKIKIIRVQNLPFLEYVIKQVKSFRTYTKHEQLIRLTYNFNRILSIKVLHVGH